MHPCKAFSRISPKRILSLAEVISTAFTAAGSTWLAEVSSVNTKTIQVLEKVLGRSLRLAFNNLARINDP